MTFKQADGRGTGVLAGVDSRHRALTAALIETESNAATAEGLKYNINTGLVTLTNALETTILYLKNNDERDIVVDALIYNLGRTNGDGDRIITVVRNPTAGDIITNANPVPVGPEVNANLNYGSSKVLNADIFLGASGEVVVSGGGLNIHTIDPNSNGRIAISPGGVIRIPNGNSLAINYTPPAGNTSQNASFALNVYVKEVIK